MIAEPLLWAPLLWAIATGSALAYGLIFVHQPVSALRTVVKTASVAALALVAFLAGGSWLLVAALAACAIGDAFLAGDPKRWLPFGLVAFLIGHLLYVPLFLQFEAPPEPVYWLGVGAVGVAAGFGLRTLWSSLGKLKIPVVVYTLAIVAMVASALLLPPALWPATVGAIAFMASDLVLSQDLFRGARLFGSPRVTAWTIWFLYWGGQAGICWGMMRA
ncbi:lysoplasmalogenase [Caulobacter sp. RHG1]|uniref:lysoplasmalogenase n=1 Tax=Caulobacter sp. (strain RHG1) TaxID=2545762 RepID=UPI001552514C|nr:lysoplasmalogenase [Caulobacter sp. RHG1]NQE62065.1 hypothetical protein [Caulobacter sp. RHG1]